MNYDIKLIDFVPGTILMRTNTVY